MVTDDKIKRINALAAKAKSVGLTPTEKMEQRALRNEYIQAVRGSLRANLESIRLVDENGNQLGALPKKHKH
ncbi:DUF896 domain-containing protein [Aneurinibacillus sp. Ricciae_BoGa-3]|uniref:DUF896 domain-containing protein n=1 Tax=Aneurinibacillus sp. Ricciae_BoGa-3 TaxID=3022697 RepID=UPI002340A996|nr:DUF896 domain-containing protein [Aneurinibacillus sp. Ricciae_BoGa-3]WCK52377.1 DUF896 domain-containing protein [Aneurinibacillus sp. Ricciae_BoGa-3]